MATVERTAAYEAPGRPGSPVELKARYDTFTGGHRVPPIEGRRTEDRTPALVGHDPKPPGLF